MLGTVESLRHTCPAMTDTKTNVTALIQDSAGRIWCGTGNGLFEMLSDHKFRRQRLPPPVHGWRTIVTDVLEDAGGKLWLASNLGIYVIARDGSVEHVGKEDGLPQAWVEALLLDKQGRLWAGTRGGLVSMRDGNKGSRVGVQQAYRYIGGLKGGDVKALAEGSDGAIWASTSSGIVRSLSGSSPAPFRLLTRAQGLIDRQINALTRDRAGNMWAGTEGAGVMKIQPDGFTTFHEQDGLATDRVRAVLADRTGAVLAVTASPTPPRH